MKRYRRGNKKAFTLVELLVVIAVLGIMAGIGLNSMSGITDIFRKRADDKTLDQVARTMQIRLMADDHKLLPASPSSELVYTTDIVPEMNLISQTTGELMIAKATGYKIFDNSDIAQDSLNTNDLELYVTFYSDSADGKTHYMRKATISATYINWEDGDGSGSGSGSGDSGNESDTYISYEGSENFNGYFTVPAPFSRPTAGALERNETAFDTFIFEDEDLKQQPDMEDMMNEHFNAKNVVTSNLQTKNFMDAFFKEHADADFSDYVSLGHSYEKWGMTFVDIDELNPEQFGDLDIDSSNTLISPVTGAPYKLIYNQSDGSASKPMTSRNFRFVSEGNGLKIAINYTYFGEGTDDVLGKRGLSEGDVTFFWAPYKLE